jgi:hypothetical protein
MLDLQVSKSKLKNPIYIAGYNSKRKLMDRKLLFELAELERKLIDANIRFAVTDDGKMTKFFIAQRSIKRAKEFGIRILAS